jgi:hypothetical protein
VERGIKRRDVRIARTVHATHVLTARTDLVPRDEQRRALVAIPAHSLHGFLAHQRLAAGLRVGLGEEERLAQAEVAVGLNGTGDGDVLGGLAFALLAGGLLRGVARAGLAADMVALDADLVGAKGGGADVTGAVDAHADGLLDAQGFLLGADDGEGIDGDLEAFGQLACALGIDG